MFSREVNRCKTSANFIEVVSTSSICAIFVPVRCIEGLMVISLLVEQIFLLCIQFSKWSTISRIARMYNPVLQLIHRIATMIVSLETSKQIRDPVQIIQHH
jgi:hypothetical protein